MLLRASFTGIRGHYSNGSRLSSPTILPPLWKCCLWARTHKSEQLGVLLHDSREGFPSGMTITSRITYAPSFRVGGTPHSGRPFGLWILLGSQSFSAASLKRKYSSRISKFRLFLSSPNTCSFVTWITFWLCRSYLVCVRVWRPKEAPTMMRMNGTPKSAGCFLRTLLSDGERRGLDGKTGIFGLMTS